MASARQGLDAVPDDVEVILILLPSHPLASPQLCELLVQAVRPDGIAASAPVEPLPDALKTVENGRIVATASREGLMAVPFPAAFNAQALRLALAPDANGHVPDYAEELEAVEKSLGTVVAVPNEATNLHVTTPEELAVAEALLPLADRRWV